jgi:hypothetical protein
MLNTFKAVNTWEVRTGAGGKPKRKRQKQYLELPDGTIVEVGSWEEAQRILALYYESLGIDEIPETIKKQVVRPKKAKEKKSVVVYSEKKVANVFSADIRVDVAIKEAELKRKIRKRRDEEALIALII